MPTWTTPKTDWDDGEIVNAEDMNEIGDNLAYLKTPPFASVRLDEAANYTTTSTTFVDVNATRLALTITTSGGDVLITFAGAVIHSSASGGGIWFDVLVDAARLGGDDGILGFTAFSNLAANGSFSCWATGLTAGTHTFKLQWKTNTGTATMWAGAGTATSDLHPMFAVREVS